MNHSPYQTPIRDQDVSNSNVSNPDPPTILPFAQLGLRLLGVMLVVDGMGALLGGSVQWMLQIVEYSNAGYSTAIDPHSAGWGAGGIPYLVTGLYLITGGDTLLRVVFLPSRQQQAEMRAATEQIAPTDPK